MVAFVVFGLMVAAYVVFLLWCLAPLFRRSRGVLGWLRILLVPLLLGANLLPLLALPLVAPVFAIHAGAGEQMAATALFLRTVPAAVANIRGRESATATVVDVAYPIEIAGIRYAPVVRTACTTRRKVSVEKGLEVHVFQNYPTASDGEFLARAANAIVAFDQSYHVCSMASRGGLQPGPFPDRQSSSHLPRIHVVRGEAERTQVYALWLRAGRVAVDDLALEPPQIARVEQAPARDVIALDALWPMNQRGDINYRVPDLIEAYQRLPAGVNACVEFITTSPVSRFRKTTFRDIPESKQPAYCREELAGRIPKPQMPALAPAGG